MKGKLLVCAVVLAMFFAVSSGTVSASTYLMYDHWGGTWSDANKNSVSTEDDLMCWAATAANMLSWTGWGYPTGQGFTDADSIFAYYQDHWTDAGGNMFYGIDWWFDGTNNVQGVPSWSQVDVPGGGFWPAYNVGDYYWLSPDDDLAMSAIDVFLHAGYGVGLGLKRVVGGTSYGHAITCWGYDWDSTGNYLGIWVTDSDDNQNMASPPATLDYYQVASIGGQWYLQDYFGTDSWWITEVHGLERVPFAPVPLPAPILLFGSGLIGLAGLRKRFLAG